MTQQYLQTYFTLKCFVSKYINYIRIGKPWFDCGLKKNLSRDFQLYTCNANHDLRYS